MSFVLLVLFALLTKPILESSLIKGSLGFFKTYFIFGGVLTFAVAFLIMYLSINNVAEMNGRGAAFKLAGIAKAILTIASFYYLMLSIALHNVSKKSRSYLIKISCSFFIFILILSAAIGIFISILNSIIYITITIVIYKFVWKQDLRTSLRTDIIL